MPVNLTHGGFDMANMPPPRGPKKLKRGRDVFTTGQIAGLLGVAPRTVAKWIDKGRLKGYTVPSTTDAPPDRRVTRANLIRFVKDNRMEMPESLRMPDPRPLAVYLPANLLAQLPDVRPASAVQATAAVVCEGARVVIVGCCYGRGEAVNFARDLTAAAPEVKTILTLGADASTDGVPPGVFAAAVWETEPPETIMRVVGETQQ